MAGEIVLYNKAQARRYQMAFAPGVAESLTPAERLVYKAQFGRPISDYPQPELLAELKMILRGVSIDVGCRIADGDFPYVVARAGEVLRRYYGGLTLTEFRMAFEMCALGELDDYLPKREGRADRGHYQMFNVEYMSKVLTAYQRARARVMNAVESKAKTDERPRDIEAEAAVRRGLYNAFIKYKYTGRMPYLGAATVICYYNRLARLGFVDDVEVSIAEQKAAILSEAARIAGAADDSISWRRDAIEKAFAEMAAEEFQLNKYL